MGKAEEREATRGWDLDAVRFHVGSGLIGFLDEVALFGRPLTEPEVARLARTPDPLQALK